MKELKVNATRDQIEEFKESVIWQDIRRELFSWQRGFNKEMMSIVDEAASENPSTASVLLHMGDLNGRQKAVDYLISLPDVFLSLKEEEIREREENKDER